MLSSENSLNSFGVTFREKQRLEQLAAKKEKDRPRQMLEKQVDPAIQAELQAQKEREEVLS